MPAIRESLPRVDAAEKAGGAALYLADIRPEGLLYARILRSTRPRARITSVRYPELPPGYAVVDLADIPPGGSNGILMIKDDWPVFADGEVRFLGQTIALVVGPDRGVLEDILRRTRVTYQDLPPAFTIEEAEALPGGPIHGGDNLFADLRLKKGDPDAAFLRAASIVEEEFTTGFQEHVYMEPQGCMAAWEDGRLVVRASMQCPFYLRKSLLHTLGCAPERVRVIQPHCGGGFGGKEHYPDVLATAVAVAVWRLQKPVQLVLDRREDILYTPKRHPSHIRIRTALDASGQILAMDVDTRLNAGAYLTCSNVVLQRAIFHATGVYDIPSVSVRGRTFATNVVPSDAFRGFGAPQALFAIEMHMTHLARQAGEDPVAFKARHLQRQGSVTLTNGRIHEEVLLGPMMERALTLSGYGAKCARPRPGQGIGVSLVTHGCAFTGSGERDLIRARVALKGMADGRVRILAAGVDMGQGLLTTFRKVVCGVLGLPMDRVLYDTVDTDAVPDSGPSCASRSIQVVGRLLQEAAEELKEAWQPGQDHEVWREYRHPAHLRWDQESLTGDAYPVWGWGVNVVEVAVDPDTREVEVTGAWAVYDAGVPVDRLILEGQAQGGMTQALGWAGLEKMELSRGVFRQGTMADYAIPTTMDFPALHVEFFDNPYPHGPFGAKGSGELVFDGAAPAFAAAVEMAAGVRLREIPVTPERLMEDQP
jgi:CO/xanthine dehydrogenase Mo-binding subunit